MDGIAAGDAFYACRRCRTKLFEDSDLMEHESQRHDFSYKRRAKVRVALRSRRSVVRPAFDTGLLAG